MSTNMVNIQREDHTNLHGIEATFSQTRVLPIVGKTSRADIALKSVDVQTKSLPIFQPQVQIGADINRLIYEIGLSATWRNSILELPVDGSCITPLIPDEGLTIDDDEQSNTWAPSTFQNTQGATLPMIDTFNTITTLSLIPTGVKDTLLSILFDYWNNKVNLNVYSALRTTCLTPVVVGSGCEKILNVTTQSTGSLASALVINVKSTDGFSVGDRVRFFGIVNTLDPQTRIRDVFASVYSIVDDMTSPQAFALNLTSPAIIFDYNLPGQVSGVIMQMSPPNYNPCDVWFVISNPSAYQIGQVLSLAQPNGGPPTDPRILALGTITVDSIFPYGGDYILRAFCAINWTTSTQLSSNPVLFATPFAAEDGYVINQTVKDGGHIEFLTDEFEFQPVVMDGMDNTITVANRLFLQNTLVPYTNDYGFWRGYQPAFGQPTNPFTSPVQISVKAGAPGSTPQQIADVAKLVNGYYRIVSRQGNNVTYVPISKTFPATSQNLFGWTFEVKLAPNFYTLDIQADELIDSVNTTNKYSFMRALGYTITDSLPIQSATYPPTASTPSKTWTRAYTVSWDFSAYRNLTWVPQDLTANLPRPPLQQQDFGGDSGAVTYYNVYEFNKFLNDCVNLGIQRTINDSTSEIANLGAFSLNGQLAVAYNAYSALFKFPVADFLWSPSENYVLGDLAITGLTSTSLAFVAVKSNPGPIPRVAVSTIGWFFLGYVPYLTGEPTPYALCLKFTQTATHNFTSAGVENGVPGRVYNLVNQINVTPTSPNNEFLPFSTLIPVPVFITQAPSFYYNDSSPSLLCSLTYDGYGFGANSVNQIGIPQSRVALYTYKRKSWGNQGASNADEWLTFESNTSFKFLLDNFPAYCTSYEDTLSELRAGVQFPNIEYWVWDHSKTSFDPRTGDSSYEVFQTSESMSSCMSPVQSIVVVGNNIPVLEELASPVSYLIDSDSSAFTNRSDTISLTQKVIGEVYPQTVAPYNSRSIVRFEMDVLHYNALLDTKLFKHLEYSLFYRHRITQELIPLVLSNYGSVNIKFVFRPIS